MNAKNFLLRWDFPAMAGSRFGGDAPDEVMRRRYPDLQVGELHLMIKNHPFKNGNKRIAMTTLFVFLYKNKKWLRVNSQELYNFSMWVAQSPAKLNDAVIEGIKKFLKVYLVPFTS